MGSGRAGVGRWIRGVLLALALLPGMVWAQNVQFRDVTNEMAAWGWRVTVNGVRVSAFGHGASFADVNGDSIPDLYISSAKRKADGKIPETLYIGQPNGAPYSEEDGKRNCSDSHGMTGTHGISFFDYDNDGDFDIYNATTDDLNRLYRNNGIGYFDTVNTEAGLYKINKYVDTYGYLGYGTRGVVAFDADNDGDMDLLGVNWGPVETKKEVPWVTPAQPNEFYLNLGDGTFRADTTRGLTHPPNPSYMGTQGVTAADVNGDGWMDIFICHRNYAYLGKDENGVDKFGPGPTPCPNQLLINDRTGHFVDETKARGLYNALNDCNGATFADFDNDGDLDAFVVPKDITTRKLEVYKNDGNGYFVWQGSSINIEQWGFSAILGDYNNDGFLDLFASRSYDASTIYLNNKAGNFVRQATAGVETPAYDPRGGGLADIDNDGDLDIYYVDANKDSVAKYSNRLYRNDTPRTNHWLKVTGRGPEGDAGGMGTKIWVFEAGAMNDMSKLVGFRQVMNTYGYLCQDDPVQHFGLGSRTSVDVKVRFLDGCELAMANVAADRKVIFTRPGQLALLDGDRQAGTAGQLLAKPLRVKVTDIWGRAVRGAAVRFADSGSGAFSPAALVYTGADGIASVSYRYAGGVNDEIVTASTPDISGAAAQFTVVNSNPVVPAALQWQSATGFSGTVGRVLPDSLTARVVDSSGQPVRAYGVDFTIAAGGGLVNGMSSVRVQTNSQGYAKCQWRLGTTAGVVNQLRIAAGTLQNSPQIITATAAAGPAWQLGGFGGDGQSAELQNVFALPLTAAVADTFGNPVAGQSVLFTVLSGSATINNAIAATVTSTADGRVQATLRAGASAGAVTVQATAQSGGRTLLNAPHLYTATVTAPPPPVIDSRKGSLTATTPVAANNRARSNISVVVRDSGNNPVAGVQVTLFCSGSNNSLRQPLAVTNAQGQASGTLASTRAETKVIWAEVDGVLAAPDSARVVFQAGPAAVMAMVSGDNQSARAGRSLPLAAVIALTDSFDNPVPAAALSAVMQRPDNSTVDLAPAVTDAAGRAVFNWSLSSQTGLHRFTVRHGALPPVTFTANALAIPPSALLKVSGDNQIVLAGSPLAQPLLVRVVDDQNQPLGGVSVSWSFVTGTGTFPGGAVTLTGSDGLARVTAQPAATVGTFYIEARVEGLDKPITFIATTRAPRLAALAIVAGDGQSARENTALALPLQVRVLDELNQPVAGALLQFQVLAGGGRINPETIQVSGSDGTAAAVWTLGSGAAQQVQARLVDNNAIVALFNASISANQAPQLAAPADTLISEGGRLVFRVRAGDPEGDAVTLTAFNLPAGAAFDTLAGLFTWNPGYDQAGAWKVTFQARDRLGAATSRECRIQVLNVSRPLMVLNYAPADTLVTMELYTPYYFEVTAFDPDGDSLRYQWSFNGLSVGTQPTLRVTANPAFPARSHVSVRIYTRQSSVTLGWTLDIRTDVEQNVEKPSGLALGQNYPNPFNPVTHIPFQIDRTARVTLAIYNQAGQLVRRVYEGTPAPGWHQAVWDAHDELGQPVPSGTYYCRMESGSFQQIKKLLLLK